MIEHQPAMCPCHREG